MGPLVALVATVLVACQGGREQPNSPKLVHWQAQSTVVPLRESCPDTATKKVERVVIVSLDGLMPQALLLAPTPHLDSLWQGGAYTWQAQTVLPSVTLPAHASMVSGQDVPNHGINWNDWQPELGYLEAPTMFTIAKEAGLKVAAFVGKKKLKHLLPPGSVDYWDMPGYWASDIMPAAVEYLLRERPQLLFIHLPDLDSVGHAYGWMSREQLEATTEVDEAIGLLLAALRKGGLWETTLIIVTSDHGGHGRVHGSDDPQDTTIPWIAYGPGVQPGLELQEPVHIFDTAPTVLAALGLRPPKGWDGNPLWDLITVPYQPCPAPTP